MSGLGGERTWVDALQMMSAFDPKRTSGVISIPYRRIPIYLFSWNWRDLESSKGVAACAGGGPRSRLHVGNLDRPAHGI
jgi:hypothetical protein